MARERVHRLRQSPGPWGTYIHQIQPPDISLQPSYSPDILVSTGSLPTPSHETRHGSQNTTARKPSRCTALTLLWSHCSILSSSRGQNAKSLGPRQTPCLNILDNTRALSPVTVGLFNSIQFWFFFTSEFHASSFPVVFPAFPPPA